MLEAFTAIQKEWVLEKTLQAIVASPADLPPKQWISSATVADAAQYWVSQSRGEGMELSQSNGVELTAALREYAARTQTAEAAAFLALQVKPLPLDLLVDDDEIDDDELAAWDAEGTVDTVGRCVAAAASLPFVFFDGAALWAASSDLRARSSGECGAVILTGSSSGATCALDLSCCNHGSPSALALKSPASSPPVSVDVLIAATTGLSLRDDDSGCEDGASVCPSTGAATASELVALALSLRQSSRKGSYPVAADRLGSATCAAVQQDGRHCELPAKEAGFCGNHRTWRPTNTELEEARQQLDM